MRPEFAARHSSSKLEPLASHILRQLLAGGVLAVGIANSSVASATTTAHARTAAGSAQNSSGGFSCGTSAPDPIVSNAFTSGMGLPTEGYAFCNLSGSTIDQVGAEATSASSSATRTFNDGQANVAASAVASYDHVGAKADATFTGYTSGLSYHSAEGAAIVDDTLTFSGGTGAAYVKFGFTVDGALTASAGSESQIYLAYTAPGNTPQFAFAARIDAGGTSFIGAPSTPDFNGFTANAGGLSGSGLAYTGSIGMTFGTPLDFQYGLRAYAYAAPYTGNSQSNFLSTARLTSILVTDTSGTPMEFTATSISGTLYDAQGAHAQQAGFVPEPASWALMVAGFGIIGGALRRQESAKRVRTCII